jgi:hypothetical protein
MEIIKEVELKYEGSGDKEGYLVIKTTPVKDIEEVMSS